MHGCECDYADAVAWAGVNGIVYGDGTFAPNQQLQENSCESNDLSRYQWIVVQAAGEDSGGILPSGGGSRGLERERNLFAAFWETSDESPESRHLLDKYVGKSV